jgi:hypothetical protein
MERRDSGRRVHDIQRVIEGKESLIGQDKVVQEEEVADSHRVNLLV